MDKQTRTSLNPSTAHDSQADSPDLSRRGFLGGIGGTAAAATLGGLMLESALPGGATAGAMSISEIHGGNRLLDAFQKRVDAAHRMVNDGLPVQTDNGDEDLYPNSIGNYSKGLTHNAIGEVVPAAYNAFLAALASGDPADFEVIPMGGVRKMTNPQSGLAYDTEGNDPQQFAQPPAPAFASAWEAGESVELYWMALLRDTRFSAYGTKQLVQRACDELNSLSDFRGPTIGGLVTPQSLFRDDLPGCLEGPYISQFLLKGTPFGAEFVERKMRCPVVGDDHMTTFSDWLAVQRGNVPGSQTFDTTRRYIRNGRDLAEWVHIDVLFQAYFNACLILDTPPTPGSNPTGGGMACPPNPGNPYLGSSTQIGFGTWGSPFFKTMVCEVARALKAVWFQKWFVHRRLRPEAYAGRVHVHKSGMASYPIHADVLDSEVVDRVHSQKGTYLLPMVFPEGSPTHPSYGAGHATVAGACVTMLKALFDESFEIPNPVVPNNSGLGLVPYVGPPLTVGGELNKLASNIGTGRNIAGVHWRSDAVESYKLGEAVAIAILKDHAITFNEGGSFQFTKFDGTPITIP